MLKKDEVAVKYQVKDRPKHQDDVRIFEGKSLRDAPADVGGPRNLRPGLSGLPPRSSVENPNVRCLIFSIQRHRERQPPQLAPVLEPIPEPLGGEAYQVHVRRRSRQCGGCALNIWYDLICKLSKYGKIQSRGVVLQGRGSPLGGERRRAVL
jgi:hypothetical protein